MKIRFQKYLKRLLLFLLALAFIFTVNGTIERQYVKREIRDFVSRAEYIAPGVLFDYDDTKERFYIVRKKYDYEDVNYNTYDYINEYIGSTGDIIVTNRNPLSEIKILDSLIVHFWIGHAGLVLTDDGSQTLEIVGNDTLESNEVLELDNTFNINLRGEEVVGLRIKGITSENKERIQVIKDKYLGKKYNYLFIINLANRFYCIDLITRVLEDVGIRINYDFWVSTGNDMITSKNTYLFYYSYVDKKGIIHRYFLVDQEFSI
ncbi:MAG TPA: YiiX/YebB-like N1pC/P60 family cysteine hydrolase [Bacilli bacterium]|nr:YiiX/YebB-like N1pC/P60 family cysteine hydrolase [Bacilli bacterium]